MHHPLRDHNYISCSPSQLYMDMATSVVVAMEEEALLDNALLNDPTAGQLSTIMVEPQPTLTAPEQPQQLSQALTNLAQMPIPITAQATIPTPAMMLSPQPPAQTMLAPAQIQTVANPPTQIQITPVAQTPMGP